MINEDHYLYIKHDRDIFVILSLYIDHILLVNNNNEFINTIKRWLASSFKMKDMKEATYILSVKIYKDCSMRLLALSQKPYIKKILERFYI